MIEIKDVGFSYENARKEDSIKDITVTIPRGQVVLLCGESGSGKTTFGRLVNGLIPCYYEGRAGGSVTVQGKDLKETELHELAGVVGSVFQNPKSQFYTLSADTEIVFGCENIGMPKEEILDRFAKTVRLFQIEKLLGKSLLELSGGEKQKIACASVNMLEPEILVLDEPTSNLDIHAIHELRSVLELWKKKGKTILIAEHRLSWVRGLADRVLYFKNGTVAEDIPAELFWKRSKEEFHLRGLRCADIFLPQKTERKGSGKSYTLTDFSFSYKNGRKIEIPELEIKKGAVVAILGDNGAGKSTFAKCICGLMKHCRGKISDGEKVYRGRRLWELAYLVFQDVNHQLFSESVKEEVTLGLPLSEGKKEELAGQVLRQMGLLDYKDCHPMSLSGGQKQRLAVAGAMASGKDLIVYDEPTSGLDYRHMEIVADMINDLSEKGKTQFIITHDPELVERCCDRFLFLKNGKVECEGSWTKENIDRIRNYFGELAHTR